MLKVKLRIQIIKILTVRDQAILNGLLNFGMLNTRQIKTLYFSEVDKRTVLRRLRKLTKSKWIVRQKTSRGGEIIWTLSAKGAKYLSSDFYLKTINRTALRHDLAESDIRISLDKLYMSSQWRSINLHRYKSSSNTSPYARIPDSIPDWLFTMQLKKSKTVMAMEVELHFKGKRRMQKVFSMYSDKKSINHVWYLVPNSRFGEKIIASSKTILHERGKSWVLYSIINDVLKDTKNVKIYFDGCSISIKNLCGLDAHSSAHPVSKERNLESVA